MSDEATASPEPTEAVCTNANKVYYGKEYWWFVFELRGIYLALKVF